MGRLVGEGEVRWKQWMEQPHTVKDSLMTIRDKATHLLLEMRTSVAAGLAQARDQDEDQVNVGPAPQARKGTPFGKPDR